jgi:hypothetical protein
MLSTMSLSLLLLVVSLAAGISEVDADAGHSSMIKNLRGVTTATAETTTVTAPAPAPDPCRHHLAAPSIRILQEEDDVPTLSPVIVEYWDIIGDGYGNPNRPGEDASIDQVEIVAVEDLPLSDATTTDPDTDTTLNDIKTDIETDIETDSETDAENDIENDIDNIKSKDDSPKDDQKWVILVAVLSSAAFLIMLVLLVLVCRARRRNRLDDASKQVVNGVAVAEKRTTTVTPAVAAAAARMAADHDEPCDPTETDREFSEHPDIHEILTGSDKASIISSV